MIVVGAGLSGLAAAGALSSAGHEVTVFDKGRGPGGRLATRRIGPATVDHGAQFFTVRSRRFEAMVEAWISAGVVGEWTRGFADRIGEYKEDGYPRYKGTRGMTAIAE